MPTKRKSNLSRTTKRARALKLARKKESFLQAEWRRLEQCRRQAASRAAETPEQAEHRRRRHSRYMAAKRAAKECEESRARFQELFHGQANVTPPEAIAQTNYKRQQARYSQIFHWLLAPILDSAEAVAMEAVGNNCEKSVCKQVNDNGELAVTENILVEIKAELMDTPCQESNPNTHVGPFNDVNTDVYNEDGGSNNTYNVDSGDANLDASNGSFNIKEEINEDEMESNNNSIADFLSGGFILRYEKSSPKKKDSSNLTKNIIDKPKTVAYKDNGIKHMNKRDNNKIDGQGFTIRIPTNEAKSKRADSKDTVLNKFENKMSNDVENNEANNKCNDNASSVNKPYFCDRCDYKCTLQRHLFQHKETHTGAKPYACNICEYKCLQRGHLDQHMRTHSRLKPYACNLCEYRCKQRSHLDQHMRTHSRTKPYSCKYCEYKCVQKSHLDQHMRRHTGMKPYNCKICGYKCVQKCHLNQHMNGHKDVKPFFCDECGFECARKGQLNRHVKIHSDS